MEINIESKNSSKRINKSTLIAAALLFGLCLTVTAQEAQKRVNFKINSVAVVGIVNPAIEIGVLDKVSVQLEGMGVFYTKNFLGTGYPLSFGGAWGEARYYTKRVFEGFFAAPNMGWGVYRLNKNILPKFITGYQKNPNAIFVGQSLMVGATLGYCFAFGEHWGLEISLGYGFQHSKYEAYTPKENGDMSYRSLNLSSEWLPYKGGVFVSYKF